MTLFQLNSSPQTVQLNMCCSIYSAVLSSIHINFAAYMTKHMQWNLSIKKLGRTEVFICRKTSDSMNIGRKPTPNKCTYNKRKLDKTKTRSTYHVAQFRVPVTNVAVKKAIGITHFECVCSLGSPTCKAHAPYSLVICGMSASTIIFPHCLLMDTILERKPSLHI